MNAIKIDKYYRKSRSCEIKLCSNCKYNIKNHCVLWKDTRTCHESRVFKDLCGPLGKFHEQQDQKSNSSKSSSSDISNGKSWNTEK
jgi:hypothetical protein